MPAVAKTSDGAVVGAARKLVARDGHEALSMQAVAAIDASIAQTEGNKKLAEAALAKLHLEAPEGWTPYVTSTFQRAYDALRVTLLCPTGSLTFTLEQTLVVARPEDIGPTYTQPLATAGR